MRQVPPRPTSAGPARADAAVRPSRRQRQSAPAIEERRAQAGAAPAASPRAAVQTVNDFARCKAEKRKISMVTAYDAWSARLVAASQVDAILVGDSVAMVAHGHATTLNATVSMMAAHTRAVARGAAGSFIVADLPFLAFRQDLPTAMRAVRALVRSGAHAVKAEGIDGHEHIIRHVVESGVPVMGHIGLTPQSVHQLGGFHVRGRDRLQADTLVRQAQAIADAGCFAVVLECIPAALALRITSELTIPTIGIGAGDGTDGQILVLQDLWGITTGATPRFVRRYCDGNQLLTSALDSFASDVQAGRFPARTERYS